MANALTMKLRMIYLQDKALCPGEIGPWGYDVCNDIAEGVRQGLEYRGNDDRQDSNLFFIYDYSTTASLVTAAQAQMGDLLFYDLEQSLLLYKLKKGSITTAKVRDIMKALYALVPGPNGGYVAEDGTAWGSGGDGTQEGLPGGGGTCFWMQLPFIGDKLNFLCDWQKYIWAAVAIYGVTQAMNARNAPTRTLYVSLTGFAGWKALKSFNVIK